MKFTGLIDANDQKTVKIALFNDGAENSANVNDTVTITQVYPDRYKKRTADGSFQSMREYPQSLWTRHINPVGVSKLLLKFLIYTQHNTVLKIDEYFICNG